MLRIYKPIAADDIFGLHPLVQALVCDVWCKADNADYKTKLLPDLVTYINAYGWVNQGISDIYDKCKSPHLDNAQRTAISDAFVINNRIEDLCNGLVEPISLDMLPKVVEEHMKPFLIKFYEDLLNLKKVKGDKLGYYKKLQGVNQFRYCPCCGFQHFSTGQIGNREDYDHYLPKSDYPFCSVNFQNLVPLCDKCNRDSKGVTDPIKRVQKSKGKKPPVVTKRRAFYPFQKEETNIQISTKFSKDLLKKMYDVLVNNQEENWPDVKEIIVNVSGVESDKVETWDELFKIKKRYAENTSQFTFSVLKRLKTKHAERVNNNQSNSFTDTLDYYKKDYQNDYFDDEKFLKIPFIQAIIETPALSGNIK